MTIGAVLYAKDLSRLIQFYQKFDLELVAFENDDYAVLESGNPIRSALTLVQAPRHVADNIAISSPPRVRSDTPTKLTIVVKSIDSVLDSIDNLGGISNATIERWTFRGHDHHDIVDPEGNVVQLKEAVAV